MQPPYTPLPVQAISPRRRAVGPRRRRLPSLRQRGFLHDVKQRLDSNTLAGFERAPPRWRHRAARNRPAGTYAERLGRACALPTLASNALHYITVARRSTFAKVL